MSSSFHERSRHWVVVSALLLGGTPIARGRAIAQASSEIQIATPTEDGAPSTSASTIVIEPPDSALPPSEFDSSELELAAEQALRTRNWFLLSGAAFGFGWILLGAGISGCETINDVEVCSRPADKAGTVGAAFVVFSAVPLLVTAIMFGLRSGQKKELELRTLRRMTGDGVTPPPLSFDTYRLTDAQDRSRRARNGLIGSTALFAVGWIFLGVAIPRCEAGTNELLCTSPGYAYMTIGLTLTGAGAIGMVVSGILLGVRNGHKRTLARTIGRRPGARFRWDPRSASFVF